MFFLLVDPRNKNHKDPETIDLSVPRHAQYLHKAWKRHQDAVNCVDINLAFAKGFESLSDSIECNHSSRKTSSLLYSESCSDGNWRSPIRISIHVISVVTKDLLETRLEKRIGFRTCSTTRSWATIQKFPIEPTNSESKLWQIGTTRCQRWHENCASWKKNVPCPGDGC